MVLKQLRQLEDKVVLPAHKGNAKVLMKKEDYRYNSMTMGMLDADTYRQLQKDPMMTQEHRISLKLKQLEKNQKIQQRNSTKTLNALASSPLRYKAYRR